MCPQDHPEIKCVVINGLRDTFVSEGGKRASFLSHIAEDDAGLLGETSVGNLLSLLRSSTKTVVCIIDGQVAGGLGLEFIMSCDYRICTQSSEFFGDMDMSATLLSVGSMPLQQVQTFSSGKYQNTVSEIMHSLLSGGCISANAAKDVSLIDELLEHSTDALTVASQIGLKHRKRRRILAYMDSPASSLRLVHFLPDQFLLYRSSQLFNLIRDYPSSIPALEELCTVLQLTSQYDFVVDCMRSQLEDRLLIPGAHTEDILQMYLRTNKVVAMIFKNLSNRKRSVIFQKIASCIIQHLHKRKDSVKCIVSTMLANDDNDDEGNHEHYDFSDHKRLLGDITDDDFEWVPSPIDSQRNSNETISLLIGVYGGQNHFLGEYKDMLASRLVSLGSFEIDREIASLDLMKSKFEPAALNDCTIMIKDMIESRKIFQKIKLCKIQNFHLLPSNLILSKHFWPSKLLGGENDDSESGSEDMLGSGGKSVDEQFKFLPKEIRAVMTEYEKSFSTFKPTQRLDWIRTEGIVVIQVIVRGKEYEFKVSPLYVEVLSLFQQLAVSASASSSPIITSTVPTNPLLPAASLTIEEIGKSIQQPNDKVRQIVSFWVSRNILREIDINKFIINE
jgi:anaphase-promoting complex subunit 2